MAKKNKFFSKPGKRKGDYTIANVAVVTTAAEPLPTDKSIITKIKLSENAEILLNIGNCQNQGARNYQEDSFGYSDITDEAIVSQKGLLAILADGMGGLSNGKAVSEYVIQAANLTFATTDFTQNTGEHLKAVLENINSEICTRYYDGVRVSAGATAMLLYILKNKLFWATAGDSRIYCVRNGNIFALNEDHDYKNVLLRGYIDGDNDLEEAENDKQKDSLVSFIGKSDLPSVDSCRRGFLIRPDDIYILCSDGIYNALPAALIKDMTLRYNAQLASEKIVETIVNAHLPGQDNMTVMVIKCMKSKV